MELRGAFEQTQKFVGQAAEKLGVDPAALAASGSKG